MAKKRKMKTKDDPYALDMSEFGNGKAKMPDWALIHTFKKIPEYRETGIDVNIESVNKPFPRKYKGKETGSYGIVISALPSEKFEAYIPIIEDDDYKKDLDEVLYKKGEYEGQITLFLNIGKHIREKTLKNKGLEGTYYGIAPFMDSYSFLLFIMQSEGYLKDHDTSRPFMIPEEIIDTIEGMDCNLNVESFKDGKKKDKVRITAEEIDFDFDNEDEEDGE